MKKLSYCCNTKDKVPEYLKSHMVYEFCCPACNSKYIGKTDQNFGTRVQEHSDSGKKSLVYNFNYVVKLHSLPPSNNLVEYLEHVKITVYGNTIELCFLKTFHIEWKKTKLNCAIKATKELFLFS